jgi:hypothetical protein
MVQRLSQLDRVDQGAAGPVVAVQARKVPANDAKQHQGFAPPPHAHPGQLAPAGQKVRAPEQVAHFDDGFQKDHPLK